MKRSFESGSSKRKRKAAENNFIASQNGSMLSFVSAGTSTSTVDNAQNDSTIYDEPDETIITVHPQDGDTGDKSLLELPEEGQSRDSFIEIQPQSDTANVSFSSDRSEQFRSSELDFDWKDPCKWPASISDQVRTFLVEKGPFRYTSSSYPTDEVGFKRHFSNGYYSRKMKNGEMVDRNWLVYSTEKNAVFCFCCKIFSDSKIKLTVDGNSDWAHMHGILAGHESSPNHLLANKAWCELGTRLRKGETIDKQTQKLLQREICHWNDVLKRIISVVLFLADRNLAFRGSTDSLFLPNNGNFLGLIELLSKYDACMQEHLRRIKNVEIHDHYLGKDIQNEIITLLGDAVLKKITQSIQTGKYYSLILDCTPDVSHQEQMTMILRFVDTVSMPITIKEHFVGFLPVDSSSGAGLTDIALKMLESLGLQLLDCRGQGYDNGANMKGCHSGVQKRILDLNPKAFYVPCGCHSLNLMLGDMAKSSTAAVTLFGTLHQIYLLFGASTPRWQILKSHLKTFTLKPISETRWECRVDSVKAVRFQIAAVYDALVEVAETANDPKARTEATALAKQIKSYPFLLSLIIWYDILSKINILSKVMQNENMQFDLALQCIDQTLKFLENYKETGFSSAEIIAKELAEELEMSTDEIKFSTEKTIRRRKVRKQFDYECADETVTDPKEKFRIEFFNVLMDQAIMSLNERFAQMKQHYDYFGFLHNLSKNANLSDDELNKHCADLSNVLTDDIDTIDLCAEIRLVASLLPNTATALQALQFLYESKLNTAVPNLIIALRIALTIPVTVASAERSFSKLKLLKNYLRSTMTQARLNHLALLSIEKEIAQSLNYSTVINEFAAVKARKVAF